MSVCCRLRSAALTLHNKDLMKRTKDYIPSKPPKVLLVGHDPRLRESPTIAEYALFADYHFSGLKKGQAWVSKKSFADLAYEQLRDLTGGKAFSDDEVYVTNLCNEELPNLPPEKCTMYIPRDKAEEGAKHIEQILMDNPTIQYVFPMSQQVNYWLQELCFYTSQNSEFLEDAIPNKTGEEHTPPYYEPKRGKAFLKICGKVFKPNNQELADRVSIFPILHCRCYPLGDRFKAYEKCYDEIRQWFEAN